MMFMEQLLTEVRRLVDAFSHLETVGRCGGEHPAEWISPTGLLQIVRCCSKISELGSLIAKAGYWECERELLEQITGQARLVLYNISGRIGDGSGLV